MSNHIYFSDPVVAQNVPSIRDTIFEELLSNPNYPGRSYQGNFEKPGEVYVSPCLKEVPPIRN